MLNNQKGRIMFTVLLILSLSAPPTFTVEDKAACTCNGKLPCSCGESCRCVAAAPIQYTRVCENGVCQLVPVRPAVAPVTAPQPMPGPGTVTYGYTVRQTQRTWGLVGRPFFPWRR